MVRVLAVGDSIFRDPDRRPIRISHEVKVIPLPGRQVMEVVQRAREELRRAEERRRQWDVVILHCGTNNIWPRNTPRPGDRLQKVTSGRQVAKHLVDQVLLHLRRDFPHVAFLLSPILPRQRYQGKAFYQFQRANDEMKASLRGVRGVYFEDFGEEFVEGRWFRSDGIHLSFDGCRRLASALRHALRRFER